MSLSKRRWERTHTAYDQCVRANCQRHAPRSRECRAQMRAEPGAYAPQYGPTRDEQHYTLDPADVMGPRYPSQTVSELKKREERTFGGYHTRRLVLKAWDALESNA